MRKYQRVTRTISILAVFGLASFFAVRHGAGGLWRGLEIAHAVTSPDHPRAPYDLTQLVAVNETLKTIQAKYVDPNRINPRQMFLSALDEVQKEVAQVIVLHEEKSPTVTVQIETESRDFRVDNVQGPWDVAARLREVFEFLQQRLKADPDLKLRNVEYAACNGILRTLDPHSVFLDPEAYKDMTLSTSGHFGGLGIVISLRDQQLTVMRPMPDTPAGRAGLRRFDRITKINNESTLNMLLDEAVNRLRGKPGTRVTVWIHRDQPNGWSGSRPFELVREEIRIHSVESRLLGDGIGYVRLRQFQSTTAEELQQALPSLGKSGKLRGLVLDLRGNPGGLLDQAARVVDEFIEQGVIVSTVGGHEGREVKRASRDGTEPHYPIVVLINGTSASASEIVAGALKNLNRAITVGQTTFGKGTVQLVFPQSDGSALKLTIAQYLTPGDVSIQGVGVTPDIALDPMTADPLEMDLYRTDNFMREYDLTKSLTSGGRRSVERPYFTLRYQLPESQREALRERGGDIEDEFEPDFAIRFARSLAAAVTGTNREEQLRAARTLLDNTEKTQLSLISADLAKLGIDWSPAPEGTTDGPRPNDFDVTVGTDRDGNQVQAGEPMALKVTVHNRAKRAVYRLHAITKSDSGYFDQKELLFGVIEPGKSRSASVPLGRCEVEGRKIATIRPMPQNAKRVCRIPYDSPTRQDVVKIQFSADGSEAPADVELRPTIHNLPRPIFAYSYQVVDNRPGNGDGQLERGEGATVYLTVRNDGKGHSFETQANLRNLTGDGVLLHNGRFDVSNMNPRDERQVAFTFDVLDELQQDSVKLELSVVDRDLRVISNEKLSLPVTRSGLNVSPVSGRAAVLSDAKVLAQPVAGGSAVGTLLKGSVLDKLGSFGAFTEFRIQGDRTGWLQSSALGPATRPAKVDFQPSLTRSPPLLDVEPQALSTTEEHIHIKGVALDTDRVADVFAFVGSRKVFYKATPPNAPAKRLPFDLDAKLDPGINIITVVARENDDTISRRTLVVRRDGPGGVALPTPKNQSFAEDWEFDSE